MRIALYIILCLFITPAFAQEIEEFKPIQGSEEYEYIVKKSVNIQELYDECQIMKENLKNVRESNRRLENDFIAQVSMCEARIEKAQEVGWVKPNEETVNGSSEEVVNGEENP